MNEEKLHPVIRNLLIDLIDQILQRPLSNILFENEQKEPFDSLKNKLESKSPISMNEFHSSIQSFFSEAKEKDFDYIAESAIILEKFFEKKFNTILLLHNYRFKDVFIESAIKAFPDIEIMSQANDQKEEKKSIISSKKGKKVPRSQASSHPKKQEPNQDDDKTQNDYSSEEL